jgi:hypothetical protein
MEGNGRKIVVVGAGIAGLCQTLNPVVCYARKIVVSADELAIGDAIILHSLGVLWDHCHI